LCSGRASASSGETSAKKSIRLLDTRTVGDGLAYFIYELLPEA
jgi:hypothetical protein